MKRKIIRNSSIICLIVLFCMVNFSAKSLLVESPTSISKVQGLDKIQFYETTLSNEQQFSFGIGEEIAVINQTAFYLNIVVLPKSNGSVLFTPRFLDFDPVPETITLGPGESNAENYTWIGTSPDDKKAYLKFDCAIVIGTNATIRIEYAFLRSHTAKNPGFSSILCLISIVTIFFTKRKLLFKKRE